ncbi:hypothetical protein BT63DRAFT_315504 [Microthyrium microscopicum]|uniref:Uncharacterized protein n=1 Tax=Microthyrium microscopicum TaxID=703497 RepID=A0A6A6U6E4_9PEZI|nr:hypothetical protein BT63DRAFT_315504 [Microthyrium microscopicum]
MSSQNLSSPDSYPVFPNGPYVWKFYVPLSQDSGITHLDTDLFNRCYLPANSLSYVDVSKRAGTQNPNYQINEQPCKRQAAINSNCYLTWNGSLASIDYQTDVKTQQSCFCQKYPFFDAVSGCQSCFEEHGGIEGYHWFPSSYINAASATYCSASSISTGFYPFISSWSATAKPSVPTSTAVDVLGTSTAASLYYTATSQPSAGFSKSGACLSRKISKMSLLVCMLVTSILVR